GHEGQQGSAARSDLYRARHLHAEERRDLHWRREVVDWSGRGPDKEGMEGEAIAIVRKADCPPSVTWECPAAAERHDPENLRARKCIQDHDKCDVSSPPWRGASSAVHRSCSPIARRSKCNLLVTARSSR